MYYLKNSIYYEYIYYVLFKKDISKKIRQEKNLSYDILKDF